MPADGRHAAGVVIADRPLVEHAPLYRDRPDAVTQYDMKSAETVGLIKFDFLGLKTLNQLLSAMPSSWSSATPARSTSIFLRA